MNSSGKASYRIKSTGKSRAISRQGEMSSPKLPPNRTLESQMDTIRSKKQLVDLLGRRIDDPKSRTTGLLARKPLPATQQLEDDSIVISQRQGSRLKSEMTVMLTEEEEDLEFEEYGFRTNR